MSGLTVVENPLNRDVINFLLMMSSDKDRANTQANEKTRLAQSQQALGYEGQRVDLASKQTQQQSDQFGQQLALDQKNYELEVKRFEKQGPMAEIQLKQAQANLDAVTKQNETWNSLSDSEKKLHFTAANLLTQAETENAKRSQALQLQIEAMRAGVDQQNRLLSAGAHLAGDSPTASAMMVQSMASGQPINWSELSSKMMQARQTDEAERLNKIISASYDPFKLARDSGIPLSPGSSGEVSVKPTELAVVKVAPANNPSGTRNPIWDKFGVTGWGQTDVTQPVWMSKSEAQVLDNQLKAKGEAPRYVDQWTTSPNRWAPQKATGSNQSSEQQVSQPKQSGSTQQLRPGGLTVVLPDSFQDAMIRALGQGNQSSKTGPRRQAGE